MGVLMFILLVILIAMFGFWDTLAAILGATLMIILLVVLAAAILGLAGVLFSRRRRVP